MVVGYRLKRADPFVRRLYARIYRAQQQAAADTAPAATVETTP